MELEKVGLTFDDDGGLKQKKRLSYDYFLPSFNLRPEHPLCLTGIALGGHAYNHIHRLRIVHR